MIIFATSLVAAGAALSTSDLDANSPFAPQQGDRIIELDNRMAMGICVLGSIMLITLFFLIKYLIYFIIFGFVVGAVMTLMEIGSLSLQHMLPSLRQLTV